jgi:tetratricopeptide (TPR) repeat protein
MTMSEREGAYNWVVYAAAALLVGLIGGYVIANQQRGTVVAATAAPLAAPAPATPAADENTLKAYRDILARDPTNVQAAVNAANTLYDAQRYIEAIPLYQQAFALRPTDINVSTDLGTALWYSGRADEALAQYDRSLKIDPTHAQTLFNIGIVQSEGKHNVAAAIQAWETLLSTTPGYPDAARVRTLIDGARQKQQRSNPAL